MAFRNGKSNRLTDFITNSARRHYVIDTLSFRRIGMFAQYEEFRARSDDKSDYSKGFHAKKTFMSQVGPPTIIVGEADGEHQVSHS